MRPSPRLLVLAPLLFLAGAGLALTASSGCGSDAVGVEACRQIEKARCGALQACVSDPNTGAKYGQADTDQCSAFYQDQCLVGIQNDVSAAPTDAQAKACVDAINAVRDCANAGKATVGDCGVGLASGADPGLSPCAVITGAAEQLGACAFVVKPADAGTVDATGDAASE
ncbi:MAG: hypothetical protein U0359_14310 [Byssovorax sp.]